MAEYVEFFTALPKFLYIFFFSHHLHIRYKIYRIDYRKNKSMQIMKFHQIQKSRIY